MELPKQQTMTPEQAFERLQTWFLEKSELAAAKSHEHLERVALSGYYFTAPVEGTNRIDLGGGFDLKLVHKYNISVDEAELDNVKAADIKKLKLPWDELFAYKPSLVKSVYNDLTAEQKKFVDQLLDIKLASPDLAIVPRADYEASKAHADAATTKENNPRYVITPDAEKAEPGNFFNDGSTWWQLNDQIEWDEVTEEATITHLDALAAEHDALTAAPEKPKRGRRKAAAK